MAINIGPRIGIDGEAEYKKQIQNIIQQTKTLKSEYDKVSSSTDSNSNSLKKNAEQHRILQQQIETQKDKVSKLSEMVDKSSEKYGEADTKTLKWQQALNEANTELNRMEQELKDLPNSIQLIGEKMESAGDKIRSAGQNMESLGRTITPVSTAAAAGLGAAAKTFIDFESGMSKVAAISGATGSDLEKLSDKAKEMGETTSFSASEAADALYYMALAGWKTEDMLDGIAPVMNLAAASGEELGATSDIVTDALTAFGMQAKDAGHFTDVLAAAAANSNTTVGMLGEAFKYCAPVAGSLGYSVDDVAQALGLMANSGIKADMAGTSLRNMLNRMAKPTKESEAAMKRLGLSLEDDYGNMYTLRQITEKMRKSFGNINMPVDEFNRQLAELDGMLDDGTITEKKYTEEVEELAKQAYGAEGAEKARAAAMLGGTRAMSAMLAIANASEADYNKLTASIDNCTGAAQNMADTMLDNTAGAITLAKSAMEGAAIEAGEVLAPYITKGADAVKDLSNKFSSLSQDEQDQIVKIAAITAAAAPALTIAGKMTDGVGSLVSATGGFIKKLGELGPEAVVAVGAIAAITAGVVALQEHFDKLDGERLNSALRSAFLNEGGVGIDKLIGSTTEKLQDMADSFNDVSQKSAQLEAAKQNVSNVVLEIDKIKTSMDAGVMSVEEAAPKLEEAMGQLADAIAVQMGAAQDVILATFADGSVSAQAFEAAGLNAQDMKDSAVKSFSEMETQIYELEEKLKGLEKGSDEYWETYNQLEELRRGANDVEKASTELDVYLAGNKLNWESYMNEDGMDTAALKADLDGMISKGGEVTDAFQKMSSDTLAAMQDLDDPSATAFADSIEGATNKMKGKVASNITETVDALQIDLIGGIDDVIKEAEGNWQNVSWAEKFFKYGNDESTYIKSQIEVYKRETIDPLSQTIEDGMDQIGVDGAGWASDATEAIIDELFDIPSYQEQANGATVSLKKDWKTILKNAGEAASKTAEARGKDVVDGFNKGVYDNTSTSEGEVTTWMDKIKKAIHDSAMRFGSPSATAEDFGKDTVDGYNKGIDENASTSEMTTSTWMDGVKGKIEDGTGIIGSLFEGMGDGIASTMDEASRVVSDGFGDIKSTFDNTKLEFPEFKLPHFSIDGKFSLNPPSTPKIKVDWYAKAMQGGMRLTNATIFGASNGKLLGGGEAGNEWIVGENSLMGMIRAAVASVYTPDISSVTVGDTTINIYGAEGQDVEELADIIDERLNQRYQMERNAFA